MDGPRLDSAWGSMMTTRTNRRGLLLAALTLPLFYVSAVLIWPLETQRAKYDALYAWAWTFEHVTGWPYRSPHAYRAFPQDLQISACMQVREPHPEMRPAEGSTGDRTVRLEPGTRGVIIARSHHDDFYPLVGKSIPQAFALTSG